MKKNLGKMVIADYTSYPRGCRLSRALTNKISPGEVFHNFARTCSLARLSFTYGQRIACDKCNAWVK